MILNVNVTGLDAIRSQFAKLGKAPEQALAITAEKVEDYIQGQIGRHAKTGALERSLGKKRIPGGWEIGHDSRVAPYARFVHDGTRPHLILPKKKKALRWPVNGRFVFSKKGVKHPGNKPDKWMERAAAQAPIIFRKALEAELAKRT
jgi:hypothetical protein